MKRFFLISLVVSAACAFASAQNFSIERYLNIRSASSPALSSDGKRLAYLTNISGTSQIWMMNLPDGAPKQMTDYDDNISFVRWSPDGDGLVFGKARGDDENAQFYWMSRSGATVKDLIYEPKVRHNFGDFSADGKAIFYTSNKRNPTFFDLYRMDLATRKETLIFQQDGNNDFAAASRDGSRIIISRDGTELSLDNNLYLVDARTGKETLLTAHAGAAQFENVHFLSNDEIIFGSNDEREFTALCRMNLTTKKTEVLEDDSWDLDAAAISDDGKTFAYTLNTNGFSQLVVLPLDGKNSLGDPKAEYAPVKLPAQGVVVALDFSKDGGKLAFTFSSAKYNADVWTYDLRTKQLTQATKSSRSDIPQTSFVEPQLIKYKTFDGKEIPAWYYLPKPFTGFYNYADGGKIFGILTEYKKGKKTNQVSIPVIVSVHGGPEGQERPGFNALYQYYLSRGYAILATNIRGSTGYGKTYTHLDDVYKREDSIKDLAYAAEWLKTSGGADAKRIAVMGGSYGGYATLAAITLYPDLWAAAVDTVGIANWESFFKNTSGYRKRQREVEYGMADKDADFLRSISPINRVDKIKTPLFVVAGRNDPRVPYTEAEQIVGAIKKRGGTVEYKLFDDEGHGVSKLKNRLELYPLVADFLDRNMK